MTRNRCWRLARRLATGEPLEPACFHWDEADVPACDDGAVIVRTLCLGTSPAQRGYITDSPSMHAPVAVGDVMRGRGVGVVTESRHTAFKRGDIVTAPTGWQDFSVHAVRPNDPFAIRKLAQPLRPYSLALGVLGAAGLTAFFGLTDIARTGPGDTVLVSAAAGGVGSSAVQIARVLGAHVVGIAGGADKCRWVTESLGADNCIDYKRGNLDAELNRCCPNGIDVFFDNVGGEQLNAALQHLAHKARVVICGFIATDYAPTASGPANYTQLLTRRARMEGLFVFDYADQFTAAEAQLATWYRAGQLKATDDVTEGLETMPAALIALFTGANRGVRLCRVAADPEVDER